MIRPALARLTDINDTITELRAHVRDRTADDLRADWAFRQTCHHALQTIGEAANHLPQSLRDRHPHVPWRDIVNR